MMIAEFQTLTGIYPTAELWVEINRAYNESELDKHIWCKMYKENKDGLAEQIARRADDASLKCEQSHLEMDRVLNDRIEDMALTIAELRQALDRELEWQPAKNLGTNMTEQAYESLANDTAPLTDLEAIRRVYRECGFDMSKIEIIQTVNTYEVNKHKKCRLAKQFDRRPVWSASDWNYIRFNVAGMQWELVNGELMMYYDAVFVMLTVSSERRCPHETRRPDHRCH